MQIIVAEKRRAWYHFVTTTCAVVGGVFTVAGILDGIFHTSVRARVPSDMLGCLAICIIHEHPCGWNRSGWDVEPTIWRTVG